MREGHIKDDVVTWESAMEPHHEGHDLAGPSLCCGSASSYGYMTKTECFTPVSRLHSLLRSAALSPCSASSSLGIALDE